ncbi:MAG: phage tail protein [Candidatus Nanopelagicales bacterium]|jgi:phage tail-like protein|nr:phage tail protein [Candidatus Nanopelagicales bacterium]
MALVGGDALTAFSFEFSVDGVTIPNVVAVNSIKKSAPIIETKSMTPTGQYVNQKMYGMQQSGELQLTVLNVGDPSVTQWIMSGLSGDQSSGRKSAKLIYKDTTGSPITTMEFGSVLISEVDYGNTTAGEPSAIQMTITLSFVEMSVS